MLHLVFQSPIQKAVLERFDSGGDVIFLENAVLNLMKGSAIVQYLPNYCAYFALAEELTARGISHTELLSCIKPIEYQEFVALTIKNMVIQTWN